ncbi:MAG: tripartite tricarboxylate transporter substrate binding protein [Proteobacteria bacterium]|nr:tripartite tricarboxylate transporter substrate binding protein [Burkholderiales bacterium]
MKTWVANWIAVAMAMMITTMPAFAQTPASSAAAAFPTKPLRVIVPSGPVGPSDFIARALANRLAENLKQSVMIDNRPGAGGTLGTMLAARSAPDGHTLLVMGLNNYVINATLYPQLPYDSLKDLIPISILAEAPLLLAVHPSLPVKNLQQLLALARAQRKGLDYASGGSGTGPHLAMELLLERVGVKMEHIAYKGAGAALNEVIAGQVGVLMVNMTAGVPFVRAGKLRAIAVTSRARAPSAPEIPTVAESGYPDFVTTGQHFAMVAGGTPREIVARLHQELLKAINAPDVRDRLAHEGSEIVGSSPEQAQIVVRDEIARWSKVIRRLGLSAS